VPMSPGYWISQSRYAEPLVIPVRSPFRVLYLTSAHPNKRISRLVPTAAWMRERGVHAVFVVSISSECETGRQMRLASTSLGVESYFEYLGTVPVPQVPRVISDCDAMCNLAVLESFTNNVVEAFASSRPLIITRSDWAQAACGDGAIYVDPEDPADIGRAVCRLISDPAYREDIVARGNRRLNEFPTLDQRMGMYRSILFNPSLGKRRGATVWGRR
jgi:glycosyltransferase involved in cell wall biosynthesis